MKIPDLAPSAVCEFGEFRIDAAKRLLHRRDGSPVPLTPKVFDTLLFLVQHAGVVLDKERLMEAVWPDSIVEENNLNKNISTLRRVFGETPGSHRYIVTVPGRGYRFVADVEPVQPPNDAAVDLAAPELPVVPAAAAADPALPQHAQRRHHWPWIRVVVWAVFILLFAVAAVFWARDSENRKPIASEPPRQKGIAVLPFDNLSTDQADAFFADGIQDDILTGVGKIKNLKVIARASVMDYRGARLAGRVREIGQTLDVSHVLEGSVRRAGDRIVVSVALIDARDERQVWAERYERTVTDAISLQGELAVEIARALQATLTPAEAKLASAKPTQNPEAYLLYLRARKIESAAWSPEEMEPAIKLYQQAVDLDGTFALARARLALAAMSRYALGKPPEWKLKARAEAEETLRIRPDIGEARLALAQYYVWAEQDYDRALAELARAAELLPNSAEVPITAAYIYKWQSRFRDRLDALQRAEALDPRNPLVLMLLSVTHRWLREWSQAIGALDRFAAVAPENGSEMVRWNRANYEFRRTGDIQPLKDAVRGSADQPVEADRLLLDRGRYEVAMLERDYSEAGRLLGAIAAAQFREDDAIFLGSKAFHEALLAVASNADAITKQTALDRAVAEAAGRASQHDSLAGGTMHAEVALLHAFAGRKEQATEAASRAVAAAPARTIERNDMEAVLAMVYAQVGEPDKALDLIERLLTAPTDLQRGAVYNMTLTDLKWRWQWDPLRSHPRFEKILAGPDPKTIY